MILRVIRICVIVGLLIFSVSISFGLECDKAKKYIEEAQDLGNSMSDLNIKESLYKEAIKLCPTSARAFNNMGDVYEKQGKLEKAIKHYRKAAELEPDTAIPYYSLGDICYKMNKLKEAKQWYQRGRIFGSKKDEKTELMLGIINDRETVGVIRSNTIENVLSIPGDEGFLDTTRQDIYDSSIKSIILGYELVPFELNQYHITPKAKRQLNELGKVLRKVFQNSLTEPIIEIAVHSDEEGTNKFNLELSKKRAEAIANYLKSHFQIPQEGLKAVGYGKRRPICTSKNKEACRAINRRIEIIRQ